MIFIVLPPLFFSWVINEGLKEDFQLVSSWLVPAQSGGDLDRGWDGSALMGME